MFGRSKELTNWRASSSARRSTISRAGRRIGGGGQRDARHLRAALVQQGQFAVFGPEIVAPLRDAMRLVDGEQGDPAAIEQRQEAFGAAGAPARRRAGRGRRPAVRARPRPRPRAVSEELRKAARTPSCSSASTWSCISAISGETTMAVPGAQQRRHLVAQRLAAAGGHQHQAVAAGEDLLDDGGLLAAECGMAEDAAEDFLSGCHALRVANRRARAVRKRRGSRYESPDRRARAKNCAPIPACPTPRSARPRTRRSVAGRSGRGAGAAAAAENAMVASTRWGSRAHGGR